MKLCVRVFASVALATFSLSAFGQSNPRSILDRINGTKNVAEQQTIAADAGYDLTPIAATMDILRGRAS